jgi:nucleoside-diphosphate-sugar epimerase
MPPRGQPLLVDQVFYGGDGMKRALICGAGGFIGNHLAARLKREGYWVRAVDVKYPEFSDSPADEFRFGDLRDAAICRRATDGRIDEVYQLAADTGGAGYVAAPENDAGMLHGTALINLNLLGACRRQGINRILFASSASMYPEYKQLDPEDAELTEESAYPAQADGEGGWANLFSERAYLAFRRSYGLDVRIARLHNVYGPEMPWEGGKERVVAALCRKTAQAPACGDVEVWGDGHQTRSFLYIDECIEGLLRLMRSSCDVPVNLGSDEMVTINDLARMVIEASGKRLSIVNVPGPNGVRGRCADNRLIQQKLGWRPRSGLREGVQKAYAWVAAQVATAAEPAIRAQYRPQSSPQQLAQ